MKTTIKISGQISGNFKLRSAIITAKCKEQKALNGLYLVFESKTAAVKALSEGYQKLIKDEPDIKGEIGGINYMRGYALSYDASRAEIL